MSYLDIAKLLTTIEARDKNREEEILSKILAPAPAIIVTTSNVTQIDSSSSPKDEGNKAKGTRYELYIGSLYEKKGYTVEYNGIKKGNKDGGIDLICKNGSFTELVQCKCYVRCNVTKKDICYFYGAVRYYAAEHIREIVRGAYWTTRKITQKYQVFSIINTLGITLYDGVMMPPQEIS